MEVTRAYFGFLGNVFEKVPQLYAYLLSTLFFQLPLVLFFMLGPLEIMFPFERPFSVILSIIYLLQLYYARGATLRLVKHQTASFFRIVESGESRDHNSGGKQD